MEKVLGCRIVEVRKKSGQKNHYDKEWLVSILEIASAGLLLPNINAEWLDGFKSDSSNMVIDIFAKAMYQADIQEDLKLVLRITNLILLHDSIEEGAVKKKCLILSKLGQKGSSKQCYERFYIEYKKILNAEPDFSYEDIFR